jgi:DNA-binding NtrC family response regulator
MATKTDSRSRPVVISWIAKNNDPFRREYGSNAPVLVGGHPVPGPTLTLLFDPSSPYAGAVGDLVLLHRVFESKPGGERQAVEATTAAIAERDPSLKLHLLSWESEDPTDEQGIFGFLREQLPTLRRRFAGRELVVHISPGTPSMQLIWVLMGATGFIEPPFRLVKTLQETERRGRPAVVDATFGVETFYEAYLAARPRQLGSEEQAVRWDPAQFRGERLRRVYIEARRFARLKIPVLLLGERGTGKTTLAGWIRQHSGFRRPNLDANWPAVACGQYTAETMRSELFGHVRGAFTGATADKAGLLATADGDTLFLDEIGDLGRDLQRLLIKALEEQRYVPLGSETAQTSNFRLLSATNIELGELRERLDPDFFDRISLVTLRLPALREIPEELPWLWEAIYAETVRRAAVSRIPSQLQGKSLVRLLAALESHPLPGNLRDLSRVAYRLLAARSDPHEPLPDDAAVDYALEALAAGSVAPQSDAARALARVFAHGEGLDAVIDEFGPVDMQHVDRQLRRYVGTEVRRLKAARGVALTALCSSTDRAIREWLNDPRKKAARGRKKSSATNEE